MALKHDGTVWTWGYNTYGELGDGTTVEHSTPIQVNGLCAINGINELHNQQMNLDISPNPSSGVFNLQMSQFENLKMNNIEIYDVYGKKIYQSSDSQILKSTIDLSNEPKGMYFIRAISEDKIIGIGKLIVE
jgi:alpha-tubulin suppressor-like RCC1 family protein